MPQMNFDLEDGKPPVSFVLKPDDCARFVNFMAECQSYKVTLQRISSRCPTDHANYTIASVGDTARNALAGSTATAGVGLGDGQPQSAKDAVDSSSSDSAKENK